MRYDEIYGCDGTLEEVLKDCSKWLKARRKRHAKPARVRVEFSWKDCLRANVAESPDNIIAALFDASLYNKRIIRVEQYWDMITVVVCGATEKTNIDLTVMETIMSWFEKST